jgi:hypothetical protein
MSNPLFASSKTALVFAGITIFGTLMMVGPGGGLLGQATQRFGRQSEPVQQEAPVAKPEKPKVVEPLDPDAGWGGTGGDAVFGDYGSSEEAPPPEAEPDPNAPSTGPVSAFAPKARRTAPLPGGTGGPVKADSLGTLVPRGSSGEAEITSRTIDIEAE